MVVGETLGVQGGRLVSHFPRSMVTEEISLCWSYKIVVLDMFLLHLEHYLLPLETEKWKLEDS